MLKLSVLFVFCVSSSLASPWIDREPIVKDTSTKSFDYFVFRQIWPSATCMFPGAHSCSINASVSTWVVHGLWPSIAGSHDGPFFCNKTLPFDPKKLDWLLPRLEEYWPNLYTDTPLESFWEHEWTKHGTCALNVPPISDESDYFKTSLDLRDKFDFGPILQGNGIVPDDDKLYDLDDMTSAIKKVLGVDPGLTCYVIKGESKQYLSQMQICLSKTFEQMECVERSIDMLEINSVKATQTDCQHGIPVHYPTIHYTPAVRKLDVPQIEQAFSKFMTERVWHFAILFVLIVLVLKIVCFQKTEVRVEEVMDQKPRKL